MRKLIKILVLGAAVCLLLTTPIFAANPVFNPNSNQNISIDGKMHTYELPVANYDGYTMLPLRALVTDLGIPNDDAHIQYDSGTKSVTLVSADGGTKIWLQQGNPGAWVEKDGVKTDLTLDCPVQNYQGSLYIPVKFVAESLDMLVVYDAPTRTVLIRTPESIAAVRDVLALSEGVKSPSKMQMAATGHITMDAPGIEITMPLTANADIDASDLSHVMMALDMTLNVLGNNEFIQVYLDGDTLYASTGGEVSHLSLADMGMAPSEILPYIGDLESYEAADAFFKALYARLLVSSGEEDTQIIVSGDLASIYGDNIAPEDYYIHVDTLFIEMVIDKATGLLMGLRMELEFSMDVGEFDGMGLSFTMTIQYEDVDVVVPQDIINKTQKLPQIV